MTWVALDAGTTVDERSRVLADAVAALHRGASALVQLPTSATAEPGHGAGVGAGELRALEALAGRHGCAVVSWRAGATEPWAQIEAALQATATQRMPTLLVAEEIDHHSTVDRARLVSRCLASLARPERLRLALPRGRATELDAALDGIDDGPGSPLLVVVTFTDQPLRPGEIATADADAAPASALDDAEPGADEWVTALQPRQAVRAAVAALDRAASDSPTELAPALEGLALAQALHHRDRAAKAALALAASVGAPETERALAAAQVRALQAVLRLDTTELRRAVADRHAALDRSRAVGGGGPGGVPMIDGITGLAAVVGVVADAPTRAPMGPVDATLLALADRLGPSAERTPPESPGDAWSELREACATAWAALSRSELGIAWWHVALLACWPQARAAGWDEAGDLLRAALSFFTAQGFDELASEARGALRASGERVPRRGRGSSTVPAVLARCGVTSREVDVLCQLDDRVSNKEIAASLYLSPRTVGHHISSLLAKTGLANRRELIALARELDLVGTTPRMLR